MNILIAIDSFKGTLSSSLVANAVEEGILSITKKHKIKKIPIADGGEGTVDALVHALNGKYIDCIVHDPLMRKVNAKYGLLPNNIAVIEMAQSSGLPLLKKEELNPLITTTYGFGEMIQDAINKNVKTIILGIGGSATNDAGIGMLSALGYQFLDKHNQRLDPIGKNLIKINKLDSSNAQLIPTDLNILVACDVNNPLFGKNGAAYVFGPQKGATPKMIKELNQGLKHYASYIYNIESIDLQTIKGTGAAGGLPASLIPYLKANLLPGIEIIFDIINIESEIKNADLIITGEGKIDYQTLMDKAPYGIIKIAQKHHKPVIALAGVITEEGQKLKDLNNVSLYNINEKSKELDLLNPNTAYKNTVETVKNIFINLND